MKEVKFRHPATWIPTAYFAMGLPLVVINQVAPLMFKNMGVSNTEITKWLAILMFAWTFKFIWSPFLEVYKTKKFFALLSQFITSVTFALVAFSLPLSNFFQYSIALFGIIAFSGATNDAATDGIYINELSKEDQAKYIGWQGAWYNVAKFLTRGVFVIIAGFLEESIGITKAWTVMMILFSLIMGLIAFYHLKMLPKGGENSAKKSGEKQDTSVWEVIKSFFMKKNIILMVAFVLLYRLAEGLGMSIVTLFLKSDVAEGGLGLSTKMIGFVNGIVPVLAFILGSLLAGQYIAKKGLKKTLFILCLCFNIPFSVYALLAIFQPTNMYLIGSLIVFEYFGYGFGFVGLILYMMQQIAPGKYKMSHYAIASGLMNLGFLLAMMVSGYLSDKFGYKIFFIIVLIATIPSLVMTWFAPFSYPDKAEEEAIEA